MYGACIRCGYISWCEDCSTVSDGVTLVFVCLSTCPMCKKAGINANIGAKKVIGELNKKEKERCGFK